MNFLPPEHQKNTINLNHALNINLPECSKHLEHITKTTSENEELQLIYFFNEIAISNLTSVVEAIKDRCFVRSQHMIMMRIRNLDLLPKCKALNDLFEPHDMCNETLLCNTLVKRLKKKSVCLRHNFHKDFLKVKNNNKKITKIGNDHNLKVSSRACAKSGCKNVNFKKLINMPCGNTITHIDCKGEQCCGDDCLLKHGGSRSGANSVYIVHRGKTGCAVTLDDLHGIFPIIS